MDAGVLADVIRTICIPAAMISAAVSIRVATYHQYRDFGQLFRFLSLALFNISVAFGDYVSIGHRVRSWASLIGVTLAIFLSLIGTSTLWLKARKGTSAASLKV